MAENKNAENYSKYTSLTSNIVSQEEFSRYKSECMKTFVETENSLSFLFNGVSKNKDSIVTLFNNIKSLISNIDDINEDTHQKLEELKKHSILNEIEILKIKDRFKNALFIMAFVNLVLIVSIIVLAVKIYNIIP